MGSSESLTADRIIVPMSTGGAIVLTGLTCGDVEYKWRAYPDRPADPEGDWEEVQEVEIFTPDEGLHIDGWGAASHDPANLAINGAGRYIVRCSATGREDEYDETKDVGSESFLIEIWPA